ncbi:hypothetical protein BO70DRAFT_300978 [Aspergillus heteromorphus CBS 117.55]|uniref:Xylanolytic transcriptional activator regulatory domain-containing protein n=1 Tax=Aspergillus heteromorphus CBS 117.55 TaxID=1448321 RepID=A0A317V716_9EURO|nr:uncharacterized protein BO70DRAFT_300978 [Aspergillus heteromorphus CBS 117.55]PWY67930.1 hypothetical protein BO70DRAFT_300978 [Aspergillus heteromorphus CBS 117.55]
MSLERPPHPQSATEYGSIDASAAAPGADFGWDNFAFSFPDFIPSQFLDTDVSLSDLLEQFPTQESEPQLPFQSPLQSKQNYLSSLEDPTPFDASQTVPRRLPSIDDQLPKTGLDTELDTPGNPWALSAATYKTILEKVAHKRSALPDFSLPSRCALVRYLEGYFRGFHDHLPFIHVPTFHPETIELELLLSMAAVGALHRFEHVRGHGLYMAARSLIDQGAEHRRRHLVGQLARRPPSYGTASPATSHSNTSHSHTTPGSVSPSESQPSDPGPPLGYLQQAQSLIILMAMSAWGDEILVPDSLAMSSQLAVLARSLGIQRPDSCGNENLTWRAWIAHQQRRRTLLVAYSLFNLQSIIFNIPPMIPTSEVGLCLPSCEAEWKASSSAAWERHRAVSALGERSFPATLNQLLCGQDITQGGLISPFSNYILIHGLVQKIYFERQAADFIPQQTFPMRPQSLENIETALKCWQCSWEATWESTLDPYSPKGPLGFNATALLRLAYIRLNCHSGLCHDLLSGDPIRLKSLVSDSHLDCLSRSPSLDRAVLQCIHALSIPVRVGIPYLSRTQTLHWSVQHSICHLECAFLLMRWMQTISKAVAMGGMASLRGDERKLITMARHLIQETDLEFLMDGQDGEFVNLDCLTVATARLWAEISGGIHVFNIVHRIGASLSSIADALEHLLVR